MSLAPAFLDDIRSRSGLASIIGRTVKLSRAGREMKGCCPFHNEKTPSFYINEEKGFYHCFGCGAHGDAISFLMEHDGLPFMDAVKHLAAEVGLELPPMQQPDPLAEKRAGLQDLILAASEWYRTQLQSPAGSIARDYLDHRNVAPSLATQFGIGFAPDSRDALSKALKVKFESIKPEDLLEAGLTGEADGRRYDRFRRRLMFPIHDARGKTVGFGGRMLGDGEPKYLNSPEGSVFHKGRLLYNYHLAAPAGRKSGRLFVVEGYMDVVALAGAGIPEAVAPLGTALTEDQVQLCWKSTDLPILSFDGDSAGQRAALRSALRILPMLVPGKSARILTLPDGLDPDDFIRKRGRDAFLALAKDATILSDYVYEYHEFRADLRSPEGRSNFMKTLKEISSTIENYELQREFFFHWRKRAIRSFTSDQFGPSHRGKSTHQAQKELRVAVSILQAPNRIVEAKVLASFARRPEQDEIEDFREKIVELDLYYPSLFSALHEIESHDEIRAIRLRGVSELLPREMNRSDFKQLMNRILDSLLEVSALRKLRHELKAEYDSDFDAAHEQQRMLATHAIKSRERLLNLVAEIADAQALSRAMT